MQAQQENVPHSTPTVSRELHIFKMEPLELGIKQDARLVKKKIVQEEIRLI